MPNPSIPVDLQQTPAFTIARRWLSALAESHPEEDSAANQQVRCLINASLDDLRRWCDSLPVSSDAAEGATGPRALEFLYAKLGSSANCEPISLELELSETNANATLGSKATLGNGGTAPALLTPIRVVASSAWDPVRVGAVVKRLRGLRGAAALNAEPAGLPPQQSGQREEDKPTAFDFDGALELGATLLARALSTTVDATQFAEDVRDAFARVPSLLGHQGLVVEQGPKGGTSPTGPTASQAAVGAIADWAVTANQGDLDFKIGLGFRIPSEDELSELRFTAVLGGPTISALRDRLRTLWGGVPSSELPDGAPKWAKELGSLILAVADSVPTNSWKLFIGTLPELLTELANCPVTLRSCGDQHPVVSLTFFKNSNSSKVVVTSALGAKIAGIGSSKVEGAACFDRGTVYEQLRQDLLQWTRSPAPAPTQPAM